ncbi:E3 UFM1-protein ligase 1 [Podila epigama]|nr:E3 UFM1-protein ligase 1 [Podila epigama]
MTSSIWTTFFGQGISQEDLKGPASLSEDACQDLINSLVRLGYLGEVATSLDGKSFITHDQLTTDIKGHLDSLNGRVSVLDLPKALNIKSADIDARITELVKSNPGRFIRIQDELVITEYLDDMTRQLNDELVTCGYFIVVEQSKKHRFSIEFLKQFLRDRVGTIINGQWGSDRGAVYTPWFIEKQVATLLQVLVDLKEPIYLHSLRSQHIVQDQLFHDVCDTLSKDPKLPGVFKGLNDQGIFVPRPYEQQQTDAIETFFKNNGFIEYRMLKKHGVADPKSYLVANHPSALLLETHAVKESIWSIVDASVEDSIANLSWIDVKTLVPSPLTKEDLSSLLRQLPRLKEPATRVAIAPDQDPSLTGLGGGAPQEVTIVQDTIIVTSGQYQKCLLEMGPLLDRKVKALVSWRLTYGGDALLEGEDNLEDVKIVGNLSSKFSLSTLARAQIKVPVDIAKQHRKRYQDFLTIQDVKEEIRKLEPDFEPALVNAIAGTLYKDLLLNFQDRNRSVILNQVEEELEAEKEEKQDDSQDGGVQKKENELAKVQLAANNLLDRIQLAAKGIDVFDDVSVKNSLSKYLLQSWCTEMLDLLLLSASLIEATAHGNPSSDAVQARERAEKMFSDREQASSMPDTIQEGPFALSSKDQSLLLSLVEGDATLPLQKLRKAVSGSYFAGKSKLNLKSTDESQLLADHMAELHRILSGLESRLEDALTLHIVTLIVFQSWTGTMLHASGKYVPRILRQLRASADKTLPSESTSTRLDQLALLDKTLEKVLAAVKQQGPTDPSDNSDHQSWKEVFALGTELSTPQ